MIKKISEHVLFLLFIISLAACQKQEITIPVDKKAVADSAVTAYQKKLYKSQIDSVIAKYNFNGSVAIFKDSEEIYRKNSGLFDFENKKSIDNQTIFAIGSVSKQFTAVLILQNMEEGRLAPEDKVSKYLKEFKTKDYEDITVHQLLNHTSGLSFLGQKLMFPPGKGFYYSNEGFNALGKIIEVVSGRSYDENIMDLFEKTGMKSSSAGSHFSHVNFAGAYLGDKKNYDKILNMPERLGNREIGIAAGGILSTVDDLHLWNLSLFSGKVIQPETLKKFLAKSAVRNHPVFGKMGYGYGMMMNIGDPTVYFHSGYIKGSPSLNIYYPETKTSVIILSNIADESKGKNAIFKPHIEIKEICDIIENVSSISS